MGRLHKLLLIGLLLVTINNARAQSIADMIAGLRSMNNTQITSATGFHSITHTIEGNIFDSTLALMLRVYNAASAGGNLQAVTALGNNTTFQMYSGIGSLVSPTTGTAFGYGAVTCW